MKQLKKLWIGLVQVRARPNSDVLGPAKGAYFNMITWAASDTEFKEKAAQLCQELELFVLIVGLIIAVPQDKERARTRKYGRRIRGPEEVTAAEFNRTLNIVSKAGTAVAIGF